MTVIYDIELFKNLFLVVFYEVESGRFRVFQISPFADNRYELWEYLKELQSMVGFNNLGFDYPVLNLFIILMNQNHEMPAWELVAKLKAKGNEIIYSRKPFGHIIWNPAISQTDLYRIHHFDNVAKSTSLKALEFVLRMPVIQELPYHHETELTYEQVVEVVKYCVKDVKTTLKLLEKTKDAIELRRNLSESYGIDMTNFNDTKIGESVLIQAVKKALNRDVLGQTIRDKIVVKDILFDYLAFYTPEFKAIYRWFENRVLEGTKEVFSNIPIEEIESLKPYVNLDRNSAGKKMTCQRDPVTKRDTLLKTLNIVHNGFQYDFGVGGIHGSIRPGIYFDNDDFAILDIDASSYYPRLAIENRYYPAHLSEVFCDVYLDIYNQRKQYPKGSPMNKALKLALNGAYGKSNSEFSELRDAQYTMTTTINGQLSLCMLAEMLSIIPNITMLQINTDGLTIRFPKDYLMVVRKICSQWENITHLDLEYVRYNKMIIRDVNNYLAVYRDSNGNDAGVKRKGLFEYKRELHQNHSMMIVPKALESYYLKGVPIEEFMTNHEDLWDFFKRVKLTGNSKLVYRQAEDIPLQKLTRYYVSMEGGTLIKLMPPLPGKRKDREFNIEADYLCTPCNTVDDEVFNNMKINLNRDYYIKECNKIIETIS